MPDNPTHKLHAAELEYALNTTGWGGIDSYTDDYLTVHHGRAVIVSCPQCEDDLTIWHMFRISRDQLGRWTVTVMPPEPTPRVRYTDAEHQAVRYIEAPA